VALTVLLSSEMAESRISIEVGTAVVSKYLVQKTGGHSRSIATNWKCVST